MLPRSQSYHAMTEILSVAQGKKDEQAHISQEPAKEYRGYQEQRQDAVFQAGHQGLLTTGQEGRPADGPHDPAH